MFTSVPFILTPQSPTGVTWRQAQVDAMHTVGVLSQSGNSKFKKPQSFIRGYKKTCLNFKLERDITFITLNSKQINLLL